MLPMPQKDAQASWVARLDLPWYWRLAIALVAVAIALVLTLLLPAIRTGTPFMFFFLAVIATTLLGNFRAGLLAIVLSLVSVTLWVMPPFGRFQLAQDDFFRLVGFAVIATAI